MKDESLFFTLIMQFKHTRYNVNLIDKGSQMVDDVDEHIPSAL